MRWLDPIKFKQSNNVVSGKGCIDLPTHKDHYQFISCWKVPLWKRIKLLCTGRIWLSLEHASQSKDFKDIYGGANYHQPTSMTIDKPFEKK